MGSEHPYNPTVSLIGEVIFDEETSETVSTAVTYHHASYLFQPYSVALQMQANAIRDAQLAQQQAKANSNNNNNGGYHHRGHHYRGARFTPDGSLYYAPQNNSRGNRSHAGSFNMAGSAGSYMALNMPPPMSPFQPIPSPGRQQSHMGMSPAAGGFLPPNAMPIPGMPLPPPGSSPYLGMMPPPPGAFPPPPPGMYGQPPMPFHPGIPMIPPGAAASYYQMHASLSSSISSSYGGMGGHLAGPPSPSPMSQSPLPGNLTFAHMMMQENHHAAMQQQQQQQQQSGSQTPNTTAANASTNSNFQP